MQIKILENVSPLLLDKHRTEQNQNQKKIKKQGGLQNIQKIHFQEVAFKKYGSKKKRERAFSLPAKGGMGLRQRINKEEIFLHIQTQASDVAGRAVLHQVTRSYYSLQRWRSLAGRSEQTIFWCVDFLRRLHLAGVGGAMYFELLLSSFCFRRNCEAICKTAQYTNAVG